MLRTDGALRVLVVVSEPPPCSSGLGLAWAKFAAGLSEYDVHLEFMGPPPHIAYGLVSKSALADNRMHAFERVPLSRRSSVLRNKLSGLAWFWWSFVRGALILWDRLLRIQDSYLDWMCAEAARLLPRALADGKFDAVLVHMPPLRLGFVVGRACLLEGTPLILAIGDPQGARLLGGSFVPASPGEQLELINQAIGIMTTEATLNLCYRSVMDFDVGKWIPSSDCMATPPRQRVSPHTLRNIMHWGQVAPWRPIDSLVDALASEVPPEGELPLELQIVGNIVDRNMRRYVRARMVDRVVERPLVPIDEALVLAEAADAFVVVVSPRHLDNTPSRLMELLQFSRPILLLAPRGSAPASMVEELGIGPIADPTNQMDILEAIRVLRLRYNEYVAAYSRSDRFQRFSCKEVARVIAEGFRRVLAHSHPESGCAEHERA